MRLAPALVLPPLLALLACLPACSEVPSEPVDPPETTLDGGSPDGGPPDAASPDAGEPDAGSGCAIDADCAARPCQTASCDEGSCLYRPAEEASTCSQQGEPGLCHQGSCRTGYRLTRALCLVADFSDATLEQHTGAGFRSVGQVREMLDAMERHWWWASLGTHRVEWQIERVTLDQPLAAGSYPGWAEYRDAVMDEARRSLDLSGYDLDSDGIVDAVWIVASSHDLAPEYVSGGASRHRGADLFVDAQSSQSVVVGAYGNFNHELGHCLGLPDLYGRYGTIGFLSLMHDSWAIPANGFTAFDRMKLGWFEPTVVDATTRGIELTPAEESFAAIRIPTPRAAEYFLVEYRRRPESGYGSSPVAHDGLSVLHVFEPATQQLDPPLLKLEPADGTIVPEQFPEPADLLSPENGTGAFTARAYLTEGEIFRIENLERTAAGLRFDVVVSPPGAASSGENLLANASFEEGSGTLPDGWRTGAWLEREGTFAWDDSVAHDGERSARISSAEANDAHWMQQVDGLEPGRTYLLCGWLRGEGIVGYENAEIGANLCLMGTWTHSPGPFGSFDWREECAAFRAEQSGVEIGCRLGFYGNTATGTAWCDGLTLTAPRSAFP